MPAWAQERPEDDPAQPYLKPAPGTQAPEVQAPPPSPALTPDPPDSELPPSEVGTDAREETLRSPSATAPASGLRSAGPERGSTATQPPRSESGYRPPPRPVPRREPSGRSASSIPDFSIRLDPVEILLEGRAGPQLEIGLLSFLTAELIPLFFANSAPPVSDLFAFNGRVAQVTQHSHGLGPIAGAAIGLGLWPGGRPFRGFVLRLQLTNYAVEYRSAVDGAVIDRATFTERRVILTLGKVYRFGPVMLEAGIGLSYELNRTDRCGLRKEGTAFSSVEDGCDGEFQIATDASMAGTPLDIRAGLYPVALHGRLAIGVAID